MSKTKSSSRRAGGKRPNQRRFGDGGDKGKIEDNQNLSRSPSGCCKAARIHTKKSNRIIQGRWDVR